MDKKIVVGLGEVLWDMLPGGKKIGGAPANFAYHVSQFGLESWVVSAVGDDSLGSRIIDVLKAKRLRLLVEKVGYPTGTVQVELNCSGVPTYDIKESVAWDNIPFTKELEQLAKRCHAVCFGSLAQRSIVSRTTLRAFLDAMPEDNGQLKVFDINLRQSYYTKEILIDSLGRCNILKINDEELDVVSSLFGYADGGFKDRCRMLLSQYHLKMLVLTCGASGSYVFAPGEESFIPTPRVEVADTVGAGDSFTAAFVSSVIEGKTLQEAHEHAVGVSAYVCTQHGAMPELPESLVER